MYFLILIKMCNKCKPWNKVEIRTNFSRIRWNLLEFANFDEFHRNLSTEFANFRAMQQFALEIIMDPSKTSIIIVASPVHLCKNWLMSITLSNFDMSFRSCVKPYVPMETPINSVTCAEIEIPWHNCTNQHLGNWLLPQHRRPIHFCGKKSPATCFFRTCANPFACDPRIINTTQNPASYLE